jgi:hypothetical protein
VCGKLAAGSTGSAEQEDGDSPTPRYRPDGIDALCKATGLLKKKKKEKTNWDIQSRQIEFFFSLFPSNGFGCQQDLAARNYN